MDRTPNPFEILAGARAPRGLTREDRVAMIGRAAEALLAGEMPADGDRLFLAGALVAWLASGGDLERDYLRVRRRGSHLTPARLWRSLIADERQGEDVALPSASRSTSEDSSP